MRQILRHTVLGSASLGAFCASAAAAPPAPDPSWVLDSASVELQVYSAYSYRLVERSTGNVLLTQNLTSFTLPSGTVTASTLGNVTLTGTSLSGALTLSNGQTGQLQFSFPVADRLQISMSINGTQPTAIGERFADQGERIYGVWETAYPTNLDNRGVTAAYNGVETTSTKNVFASSARAPFYMTSNKVGVYVPTQAEGSYSFAVNSRTSWSFNQPTLSYQVMYGSDYKEILGKYRAVAGPAYMPPDWAFGTIFWRDDWTRLPQYADGTRAGAAANAQQLVAEDAAKLQQYHIPATAIWLDRPYGSGNPGFDANVGGWGNKDYNPTQFPTPSDMARDLDARGMKLMVWIANKANNALYTQGNAAGYLFSGYSNSPAVDLRNPAAYAWFQQHLTTLLSAATLADGSAGISGFKIDRAGEGEMPTSQINTQTTLFQQLAAQALATAHPGDYFQFTRNINDTGRQYAAVWSGDPQTNWTGFQSTIRNGIRSGLIYFPTWGSDTGGYSGGTAPTEELFTRWMAFSAYTPMMEILQDQKRNIWYNYSPALLSATVTYTQTHNDLIPYVRSLVYQAVNTGTPPIRAMFLEFPTDTAAADLGDQYMYGPSLLVAPVSVQGATSRSVYLPAGNWLDYNNRSTVYAGARTITVAAPTATIPVFVREGAVIPRGDIVKGNNNWTSNWAPTLHVEVFPSPAVDGVFGYYTGSSAVTIASKLDGDLLRYVAADLGTPGAAQFYLGRFFTMNGLATVERNGVRLTPADYTYDTASSLLTVPFTAAADIRVRLAPSTSFNQWVAGNGTYTEMARWSKGSVPNAPDRVAAFLASAGAAATVAVNAPVVAGDLHFASTTSYTLAGSGGIAMTSTLATTANIDVDVGRHAVQVPLTAASDTTLTIAAGAALDVGSITAGPGRTLRFAGGGDLSTGAILNAGSLLISGAGTRTLGTLDGSAGSTSSTLAGAGTVTLSPGSSASALRVRQTSLILQGDADNAGGRFALTPSAAGSPTGDDQVVNVVRALTIDHADSAYFATLDLANNDLVIDYTGGTSPLAQIEAMLRSGYNSGTWTGRGITSSIAAANAGSYSLVVLDNARRHTPLTNFDGVSIPSTAVMVKFSWVADLDLDGVVTSNDAILFANNYAEGANATRQVGDLNYNGVFDSNDAILFANAYNESLPHLPEPASAFLLAAGLLALVHRRGHHARHQRPPRPAK